MARLFYPYQSLGDVLLVLVDPEKKAASSKSANDVTMILDAQGEAIGYNLFSFKRKCKVKANGILYFPPDEVISIVKKEIEGAGFPLPSFEPDSGYFAGKILSKEEHPLYEGTYIYALEGRGGKRLETVSSLSGLQVGSTCVYLESGRIARDGSKFVSHLEKNIPLECLIASKWELGDKDGAKEAYVDSRLEVGTDFFLERN